ncbi:hypothetical protein KW797_03135, partial [Candidatus Parcubacteria bacterium]|nr:hypothetical protein [Candidatus Parcubacteria bacterium]
GERDPSDDHGRSGRQHIRNPAGDAPEKALTAMKRGDYKARCDRSGVIAPASRMRRTWDGLFVLKELWEPRHPLDTAPSIKPEPRPAVPRPWGTDTFIEATDITAEDL